MNRASFVCTLWLISSVNGRFVGFNEAEEAKEPPIDKISDSQEWNEGPEAREARLSDLEWSAYNVHEPNGRGTFAFGYDNAIDNAGNEHFRNEERFPNGTVVGEYGYTDQKIGRMVHVSYVADELGFRAKTKFFPLSDPFENGFFS